MGMPSPFVFPLLSTPLTLKIGDDLSTLSCPEGCPYDRTLNDGYDF